MEIPEKTWNHIVSLMAEVENYTTYTRHIAKMEEIIDLLCVVIEDTKRDTNDAH